MTPKFKPGQVLATPAALAAIAESGQTIEFFLAKHLSGDWGDVGTEDSVLNNQSLVDGTRLLSAYVTLKGVRLWVVTEAADEDGNRAATTCILPEEY